MVKVRCGVSREFLLLPDTPGKFGDVRVLHMNHETLQVVLEKHRMVSRYHKVMHKFVSFKLALRLVSGLKDMF